MSITALQESSSFRYRSFVWPIFLGFFLAFPFFINIDTVTFYSGRGVTQDLSPPIPLIVILLPLFFVRLLLSKGVFVRFGLPEFFLLAYLTYIFFLSCLSVAIHWSAMLFFVQWLIVISGYFIGLNIVSHDPFLKKFTKGLFWGLLAITALLSLNVIYELVMLGGLQDRGRVSHNLFIPGFYQLFNYSPIVAVFSGTFIIARYLALKKNNSRLLKSDKWRVFTALLCIIFWIAVTGVRGSAVSFLIAIIFTIFLTRNWKILVAISAISAIGVIYMTALTTNKSNIEQLALVKKFSEINITDKSSLTAKRFDMASEYLKVFRESPLVGTGMLRPETRFPTLGVNVKSAHNMYLDVLVWSGPIGFLFFISFLLIVVFKILFFQLNYFLKRIDFRDDIFLVVAPIVGLSVSIITTLMVDNNLRVPMRQPTTGLLIFVSIGIITALHRYYERTRRFE